MELKLLMDVLSCDEMYLMTIISQGKIFQSLTRSHDAGAKITYDNYKTSKTASYDITSNAGLNLCRRLT